MSYSSDADPHLEAVGTILLDADEDRASLLSANEVLSADNRALRRQVTELQESVERLAHHLDDCRDELADCEGEPEPAPAWEWPDPAESGTLVSQWYRQPIYAGQAIPENHWVHYLSGGLRDGLDLNPMPNGSRMVVTDIPPSWVGFDVVASMKYLSDGRDLWNTNDAGLIIVLRRPALVRIVAHRGFSPGTDWVPGGSITVDGKTTRTYARAFPAGRHALPNARGRFQYDLLVSEADGTPHTLPEPPPGLAWPERNSVMARTHWRHQGPMAHFAEDPAGNMRETWHPQRCEYTNASFGHEHGSNPHQFIGSSLDAYGRSERQDVGRGWILGPDGEKVPWEVNPTWGYVYEQYLGRELEPEELAGFKVFTWRQDNTSVSPGEAPRNLSIMAKYWWLTGEKTRTSHSHIPFSFAVADADTGEVLIDTHVMASLGTMRFFDPDGRIAGDGVRTEYLWVRDDGTVQLAEPGDGGRANVNAAGGYETLQINFRTAPDGRQNELPFPEGGITIANQGPMTFVRLDDAVILDRSTPGWTGGHLDGNPAHFSENDDYRVGATRWIIFPGSGLRVDSTPERQEKGVFDTDVMGRLSFPSGSGSVRQYVKPNLDFRVSPEAGRLVSLDVFDAEYTSQMFATGTNFIDTRRNTNNQITSPN